MKEINGNNVFRLAVFGACCCAAGMAYERWVNPRIEKIAETMYYKRLTNELIERLQQFVDKHGVDGLSDETKDKLKDVGVKF